MKRYTLQVVIEEGNDHFWDSLFGKTGTDEVLEMVREMLDYGGEPYEVRLVKFEDDGK